MSNLGNLIYVDANSTQWQGEDAEAIMESDGIIPNNCIMTMSDGCVKCVHPDRGKAQSKKVSFGKEMAASHMFIDPAGIGMGDLGPCEVSFDGISLGVGEGTWSFQIATSNQNEGRSGMRSGMKCEKRYIRGVGDVVALRAGGPQLTVTELSDKVADCSWIASDGVSRCQTYPFAALRCMAEDGEWVAYAETAAE